MLGFNTLINAVSTELIRAVTGKLFTEEQIRSVTSHAAGKYLADWLPEPGNEKAARERVEEARTHIATASAIITDMQTELNDQAAQLDKLLVEIMEKKKLAEQYAHLAATNHEQFSAFRMEIEYVLRQELIAQSDKGMLARKVASSTIWIVTLVLGAALGTYFKEVLAWLKIILA